MTKRKGQNIFTRNVLSVVILVILYIFTGIFSEDKIINPFHPSEHFANIEIMVAAAASIIFGGLIGAAVGAFGYFFLEIIYRILGTKTELLGSDELITTLAFFIGNLLVGWLGRTKVKYTDSFGKMLLDIKTWFSLIINTVATIIGIGIVSNLIISLNRSTLETAEVLNTFLPQLYLLIQLTVVILPVMLFMYHIIQVFRHKRVKMRDSLYHDLDTTINQDGPAEVLNVQFQEHALQVGRWTPLDIEFKHTWKASRSYEIETVSTSEVYPHRETTSVLQENETWVHTIFVLPLEQDHVDIRVRIHPAHTVKYKEKPKQQTEVSITGKTYIQRDLLLIGVFVLGEVLITLFLFSVLWNQITTIIVNEFFGSEVSSGELVQLSIPWDLLITIGLIEALLFIPFLFIMYRVQKPTIPDHFGEVLAFSQDIQTHKYNRDIEQSLWRKSMRFVILPLLNLLFLGISGYLSIQLFDLTSQFETSGEITQSNEFIVGLFLITLITWIITLLLLRNIMDLIIGEKKISVQSGSYIQDVKSLSQLKIHQPTEVLFSVKNVSSSPGLRISFKSNDSLSPPLIELHIDPGEVAHFKTSVTPQGTGMQEILAVIYPLFDNDFNYIPFEDCQPVTSQNISYKVLGQTIIGITENQARTLRHIFGWGSLLTSTMALANEYVGIEEAIRQWQDTVPFLATIQIPFLYLYYLFSNKFLTKIRTS